MELPTVSRLLASAVLLAALSLSACGGRSSERHNLAEHGNKKLTLAEEMKSEPNRGRRTDKEWRERKRLDILHKKDEHKIKIDVLRRTLEQRKLTKEKRVFEKKRIGL